MDELNKINPMYQFSLKAFNIVFHKAVQQAEPSDNVKERVNNLIDCVTYSTFIYISRGLFERDKLTFTAWLAFQLLLMNKEFDPREYTILKDNFLQILWSFLLFRMHSATRQMWKVLVESEYSSSASLLFFFLPPGTDPLKDVESLGKKLHNVSLGQGQEAIAEIAMEKASKGGRWVILQNIYLVAKWLDTLEKLLEKHSEGSHPDYRAFMSAEPAPTPKEHLIPQGILENSVKITNEPPTGMLANLHAALDNFDQNILHQSTREQEFKTILFSCCYFHACVAEQHKFGPLGWNRKYPFCNGDLTISASVLYNYLEANSQVPWEDLCYLFGEIMYSGHITDNWDRRVCFLFCLPRIIMGSLVPVPGFVVHENLDYLGYHKHIDEVLPLKSEVHYGPHSSAETEFLTTASDNLFCMLLELQSRDVTTGGGMSQSAEEKVKAILNDMWEKLPEEYSISDITSKTTEHSSDTRACFPDYERMNMLMQGMWCCLKELDLGLKGELAISSEMEQLQTALFFDNLPDTWMRRAYPSTYSVAQWYSDLLCCRELDSWAQDLSLPSAVWISGFFNPQSFLTGRKACWDVPGGHLTEAHPKAVMFVTAIPSDRQETRNTYECPVYKTKTSKSVKWVLAGVTLLLNA
uniref:Dynein axonemal heavy chain 11 n=1 Tax=Crocodylus porosus TaxID=8502 RepID=A0A7M4F9Z8_CROPO